MIRLHPHPHSVHNCPYCEIPLDVSGWYIPGMRTLADLCCLECGRAYYGDLLAGHGLHHPMLVEQGSGRVHDRFGVGWFADWLKDSYQNRQDAPLEMTVESLRPLRRPLLLNCLDVLYGHSLLKLLNAQYYIDHTPEYDLVLLIPRFLRWMVPDGAAAIWTVDLPLRQGTQWNDWLAVELHKQFDQFEEVWLSVAFSHPHPEDFDIARFTKVQPFSIDEWEARFNQPTVTFIWREDRLWLDDSHVGYLRRLERRLRRRWRGKRPDRLQRQTAKVAAFAEQLRRQIPKLEFAVAGIGTPEGLPGWIQDLRTRQISTDVERMWCQHYARSHVVVGVHGSNMLLPSAHAGAVVELVPLDRWGNILQDFLFRSQDIRLATLLYRTLPLSTSMADLCEVLSSLFRVIGFYKVAMERDLVGHQSPSMLRVFEKDRVLRKAYADLGSRYHEK